MEVAGEVEEISEEKNMSKVAFMVLLTALYPTA